MGVISTARKVVPESVASKFKKPKSVLDPFTDTARTVMGVPVAYLAVALVVAWVVL